MPSLADLERDIVRWSNVERIRGGLGPLTWSPVLARAARAHSEEMARLRYFGHRSPRPDRRTLLQRVRKAGLRTGSRNNPSRPFSVFVGENIASATPPSPGQARDFVRSWMKSEGHRRNLLGERFRYIGVGVAWSGRTLLATQVFGSSGR